MRRLLVLLSLLLSLALVYFVLGRGEDSKMTALKAEREFKIENISSISRIVITQRNEKPTILERQKENYWLLNQKFEARENAVDNLLEVLQQIQIKFIPEEAAKENIFDEFRSIGVQLDVYDDGEEILKSYTIGGSTPDERGTYVMMNSSRQPFVVHIPSIEGSVRGRFIMSELDWRSRVLIREKVQDLNYVELSYRDQREESFSIIKTKGDETEIHNYEGVKKDFDKNKLKAYLIGFEEVYAEYIDNLNPLRDSISNLSPFVQINYGISKNDFATIKLYPLSEFIYEQTELEDLDRLKIEGRYFADCSWGDFMLVQNRLIGKLLRGSTFFDLE